jgi:hypothetical protein
MEIIFAHPTTSYDSYSDYRKLVAVSGFEVCNQDQIDINKDAIYITSPFNGDVEAAIKARPKNKRKCKIVHWFLERPGDGIEKFEDWSKRLLENYLDELWFTGADMYKLVKHIGGTKFVPAGSDERIGSREERTKSFDVCHMSYVYGRRDRIIHNLKCRIGPNCWGDARHNVLLESAFMINTHQDNKNYYEPLRFALCAAYRIPMISEKCGDTFPYEDGVDFLSAPYDQLNNFFTTICKEGPQKHRAMAERMFEKACHKFKFENNIKNAVI